MGESSELLQLQELIELFPSEYSIENVAEANRLARTRFDALDNEIIPSIAQSIRPDGYQLDTDKCFELCRLFHYIIFKGIISINGEFRKRQHKEGGRVYFGGQRHQEIRAQFSGSTPELIEENLAEAFQYLIEADSTIPISNAFRFYQKFVKTHPFYDGNGRIARLLVNLYMHTYDKFVDWKNLQDKSKFLNPTWLSPVSNPQIFLEF